MKPVKTRTVSNKQQNNILTALKSYYELTLKDLIKKLDSLVFQHPT